MKTLALSNGDLMVGPRGHQTVSGAGKVQLELALALGEYYGTDRFHPTWGTTISDYIGEGIDGAGLLAFDVRTEVARVLQNYISIQSTEIISDYLNGSRSSYETADVIRSVDNITVTPSLDSIGISVTVTSMAGQTISMNRTVTT